MYSCLIWCAPNAHPVTTGAVLLGRVGISLYEIGDTTYAGLKVANPQS